MEIDDRIKKKLKEEGELDHLLKTIYAENLKLRKRVKVMFGKKKTDPGMINELELSGN